MANIVAAAGCVVIRDGCGEPEVLLIYTLKYPDPTMPKGRIENGESLTECAIREVKEETGYNVEIVHDSFVVSKRILDSYPPIIHKTTHWFLAKAVSGSPETRSEKALISRVEWTSLSDALDRILRTGEKEALTEWMRKLGHLNE